MKDWIAEAAEEIADVTSGYISDREVVTEIIRRHSPFKDGVAYMPVPRCDGCRYWSKDVVEKDQGHCEMVYEDGKTKIWPDLYDGINTAADFGCVQFEAKS